MAYTVHQLATRAGVTARTLRYYDKVGLLTPAHLQKNGYRTYGEAEMIRLQQILFYRELEFSLEDIRRMLDNPNFDHIESLKYQRQLLKLKKERIEKIMSTITSTITSMTNNQKPTDHDMYGSLSTEQIEAYKQEAKDRWGGTDAYKQSQARAAKFTKDDWAAIKEEGHAVNVDLTKELEAGSPIASDTVQTIIARHHAIINRFYDCNMTIYRGLADMYVQDPRFAANYTPYHPKLAEYMADAMRYYADHHA